MVGWSAGRLAAGWLEELEGWCRGRCSLDLLLDWSASSCTGSRGVGSKSSDLELLPDESFFLIRILDLLRDVLESRDKSNDASEDVDSGGVGVRGCGCGCGDVCSCRADLLLEREVWLSSSHGV